MPSWVWWLLLALLIAALAIGIPLLLRSRRRAAWLAQLSAAEAEAIWFARELIPELKARRQPGARRRGVGRVLGPGGRRRGPAHRARDVRPGRRGRPAGRRSA